jgi:hypothetical protein
MINTGSSAIYQAMFTFKQFLTETVINTFTHAEKEKHAAEVLALLIKSYEKVEGGFASAGLNTEAGLIANSAFWKLVKKDGVLKVAVIYKDKGGRKLVAIGTDGSADAKREMGKILVRDLAHAYTEVSGAPEAMIKKLHAEVIKQYLIPPEQVQDILKVEVRPAADGIHYERVIGGRWVTKMMLGTPGKAVTPRR